MKKNASHAGMRLLSKPITRKIGGWVEMVFDAKIERLGLIWYRVKDGMGGAGGREDWVCDIPAVCVSVHDYHWNGEKFGRSYGSFNKAIIGETKQAVESAEYRVAELESNLREHKLAVPLLKSSLSHLRHQTAKPHSTNEREVNETNN